MTWTGAAALLLVLALPAFAQQRGATIFGTVRDSLNQPVNAADVIAQPGNRRTRTDSIGQFAFNELDGGNYVVAVRKVGYAPERWDVKLSKGGRIEVPIVLGRRVMLDTVTVVARGRCPALSLNGFMCRRRAGGAIFLDFADIDDKRVFYTADLFRDIEGFRVELRRTREGPIPTPARRGFGCVASVVDGYEASGANPVPVSPGDLSAIEVYLQPDSVPEPYQRYTWPANVTRHGRCSLIVYWTIWARMDGR
ncbi:MAG: carboxypeptidase-like regulatory domain-containing protein [Gemmatimonadaceae bacterium]